MEISENNCAFVNFIGDEDNQKHGVKELFSKIKFFFQKTDSYNYVFNRDIEKEAQELRKRIKYELLSYKIGGDLFGELLGTYFNNRHLDELVEKLHNLYIKYSPILSYLYFRALEYLNNMELKYQ